MKKIFTLFAAAMMAVGMSAANYGIMVNGSDYHAGDENPTPADPSFKEYMVLGLDLKAGDKCQLYDKDNAAGWAVPLDGASTENITLSDNQYNINKDGKYDFYIKLKYGEDQLYVGYTENGGGQGGGQGGQGGGQGGGGVEGNPRYYYKGWIDGEDVEPSEATIFDHGVAEIEFSQQAALFVLYQVDGSQGVQYMTSAWVDGPRHATLTIDGGGHHEKWNCPAGTTKLYLYDNGDGSLEISADEIPGKKLADPQPGSGNQNAVEYTATRSNIKKMIVNGQVVIVKDGVRYNLLGAEVR